jgi:hypothetical protein
VHKLIFFKYIFLNYFDMVIIWTFFCTWINLSQKKAVKTKTPQKCFWLLWLHFRFPGFINEVTCEPIVGTAAQQAEILADRTCLTGSGVCIDSTVSLNFLRDDNEVGPNRLEDWVEYTQQIRSYCGCQVIRNTALSPFV